MGPVSILLQGGIELGDVARRRGGVPCLKIGLQSGHLGCLGPKDPKVEPERMAEFMGERSQEQEWGLGD